MTWTPSRPRVTGVLARVVTQEGEHLVATSGVADLTTNQPVDPDGHFRMGSNGKNVA